MRHQATILSVEAKAVPLTQSCLLLIFSTLFWLLNSTNSSAKSVTVASRAKVASAKHQLRQKSITVPEWFARYDQIRRDAEMSIGDKWQSLSLLEKKPDQKNAALASRMLKKYATALSQIKELGSPPETQQLQTGYIEYFTTARQLFANYVAAQKEVPFTNQSLAPSKKKLEELDKKNKMLDDQLRKKYLIGKHKHS